MLTTTQLDVMSFTYNPIVLVEEFITALAHDQIQPEDIHEQANIIFRSINTDPEWYKT